MGRVKDRINGFVRHWRYRNLGMWGSKKKYSIWSYLKDTRGLSHGVEGEHEGSESETSSNHQKDRTDGDKRRKEEKNMKLQAES